MPSDASGAGRPIETRTPLRPLTLGGERLQLRAGPPSLGQDTRALLMGLEYRPEDVRQLTEFGVLKCAYRQPGDASKPSANELASA